MEIVMQIISEVGFPIACVIGLFFMWNKEQTVHAEESKRYAEAIENNTQVMNEIKDVLKELKNEARN